MTQNFTFVDPGTLTDAELHLELLQRFPADPKKNYYPEYKFVMKQAQTREIMGWINLRVSNDERVQHFGHIGYNVAAPFRGHHYAARGVRLLLPLAKKHGIEPLYITCNTENIASRKTCELAGGTLVGIFPLPVDTEMYRRGERQKCRYRFDL